MNVTRYFELALVLSLSTGISGCGWGTTSVIAGSGANSGGTNGQMVGSTLQVARSATSPAAIQFVLTDREGNAADVEIGFRSDPSGAFQPITLAAGSAPLTGVPGDGALYTVLWDFAADLGGSGYRTDIEIELDVKGGISPAVLTGVSQGNDAPSILSAEPSRGLAAEYGGNTELVFVVADSGADVVRVKVEYNDDAAGGFPESAWKLARPAATSESDPTPEFAIVAFETTDAGREGKFRWDTLASAGLDEFDGNVRVRFTPEDSWSSTGAQVETAEFLIDNNLPPQAVISGDLFALGIKDRGRIPVPMQLFDRESDDLDVVVQWAGDAQVFPTLPSTAADLRDLLKNPARAAERRDLQIAVEAPLAFTGRVGALAGLAPNEIRLPEVASRAAGLLAHGVAGRTLELLRPTTIPEPVIWTPNPLAGPVGALVSEDGLSALVLDAGVSGWRVQAIDLESGVVLGQFASGVGAPRAIATGPSRTRVFVGSSAAVFRFDSVLGTSLGAVAHSFVDGPRGLAALGTDVAVATDGGVVDGKLVRFDFETGTTATLLDGLREPWGVVADPLDEGSVYLAETSFPNGGRVSAVDLDELQPRALAAQVAPADLAALGTIPFPSPRALALENNGARLLVMTEYSGSASLRTLDLRSPIDYDDDPSGLADPFVREVTRLLGEPEAALATGHDRLRVVAQEIGNALALGGGVCQRRAIVRAPQQPSDPEPYLAWTQVVTLVEDLAPVPAAGAPWRIQVSLNGASDSAGRAHTFLWNTRDVPDPRQVRLRILPIDGDVGATTTALRSFRPSIDALSTLPTAFSPNSVETADLDGDGDLDLVTANYDSDDLTLFFQTAPGVFTPDASPLPAGSTPFAVAVADLDGDGDLDLVSANRASNDLTLFFQSTPGVFTPNTSTLPTGVSPSDVAAGDLDGDGDVDLVSADANGNNLTLFFQGAPGVFMSDANPLSTGSFSRPSSVAVGDLDGDGDLDLVSANAGSSSLILFFQGAPGVFAPGASPLPTGSNPSSVAAADLDGDGDLDLVSANPVFSANTKSNLKLFFQGAPGVFTPDARPLPTGSNPGSVAPADLDGDGDLDLVTANSDSDDLTLFFQTSPGVFTPDASLLSAGSSPFAVVTGDLDGDGNLDLVSANRGSNDLTLLFQRSPEVSTPGASPLPTGLAPSSVVAADLDGDGDLDLVSANDSGGNLTLFFQGAPGIFTPDANQLSTGSFSRPSSVAAADLDGDGDLDLVSANFATHNLTLFFQDALGVFMPGASPLPTGFLPRSVTAADLDGDGDLDLVSANNALGNLTLFFQVTPGAFTPGASPLETGFSPTDVAAADLDGDGRLDLVSANAGSNNLTLFFQGAPGVFTPGSGPLPTKSEPVSVVAADLDGDGDLDLVSANARSNNLTLFFQTAPGIFTPDASPLPTGAAPRAVAAADVDNDGDLDLVSANFDSDNLTLYFQTAPGVFSPGASPLPAGPGPLSVAAGDLDNDGDVDLVSANQMSNRLTLFFGGR